MEVAQSDKDLPNHFEALSQRQRQREQGPIEIIEGRGFSAQSATAERERTLFQFNDTAAPYPQDMLIHAVFEQQALNTPEAVAVVYGEERLTYQQLNRAANRVAHALLATGIAEGERVGLYAERSMETVIAMLGILKSGGAYVPLDPGYPRDRIEYLLEDSSPIAVLAPRQFRHQLADYRHTVISLDETGLQPDVNPVLRGLNSRNLAYVIYTSGSTGRPKGVMVEHRSVLRLVINSGYAPLRPEDRVAHCASISFDAATWEVWAPLLNGASVIVIPQSVLLYPISLNELLIKLRVNALMLTVGLFNAYVDVLEETFSQLAYLLTGGDALSPVIVARALSRVAPPKRLLNVYGPTETTTFASTFLVTELSENARLVPIGSPIANTSIYILDDDRKPTAIGSVGEIFIGGPGVARGYLNRPELTARSFIADPFDAAPGARLYRTGDLGCWRNDGTVEFRGRNDSQVKIRGFRVEPEEIEAIVISYPGVEQVCVLAREDDPGEKRLVAYVVSRSSSDASDVLSVEALRAHLKSVLPNYMVPGAFVILESLPLTANGKLDRRALPPPERGAYGSGEYEAPQGEIEEILAGIWQELLRVEQIGRRDNFFELGGHSLLVVQMMERLRRVGLSAEVRRAFESPTLADLASTLSRGTIGQFEVPPNGIPATGCTEITPQMLSLVQLDEEQIERIVRSVPGGAANIQDIYPLAPLQEGILFHHLLNDKAGDTYVLPTLLSVSTRDRLQELIAALQAVINRHDVLRTAVLWEQLPHPVQVVYRQVELPVEEVSLRQEQGSVQEALSEWVRPERQRLDLRQAPLMRLQIAADPHSERWFALLQLHHLVCDVQSLAVLIDEVLVHLDGRGHTVPDPGTFRSHVAQALESARTHDGGSFFRAKLADVEEPTAPFGLLNANEQASHIEEVHQALDSSLAQRIREQARFWRMSPATLFHAGWSLVVAHTTGRDDVVFGSVLLGRLQGSVGSEQTIGMFINTLPLRLQLGGRSVSQLIEQTQQELVGLLSHEQTSLTVAQRSSGVIGSLPLFTSILNYRHEVPNLERQWARTTGVRMLANRSWTNYPIVISIDDLGDAFTLTAQTDRRIDPLRIANYLREAMQELITALEKASSTAALEISIMPPGERRQVLGLLTDRPTNASPSEPIHELFERQVDSTPEAVAVVCGGDSLTYYELNSRANRLARYLRGKGLGPDRLVGLCLERGVDLVVGLLGILKAGGAYVPIDPDYPTERIRYILEDAAPSVLLTEQRIISRLPETSAEFIEMEQQWSLIAALPDSNLEPSLLTQRSHDLAYIIYTSGSTGKPKGVMVEHGNVTRLFSATDSWFNFREKDVWTVSHSFAFDFSVWELWGALLHGGRVVVVPYSTMRAPRELYELICAEGVTVLNQTPSAFLRLMEAQEQRPDWRHALRLIIFGGEALEPTSLRPWVKRNGLERPLLVNMYGITETTVHVTYRPLTAPDFEHNRSPIGEPIPDLHVYLLDRRQKPVPLDIAGEIYVGGAGVARGYLNRSELTAERFIRNPYTSDPHARLYKSGDLARWRPDGSLEYLGRNDHQIKLRGFRIELGEIESQLARHPQVKEVTVVVRDEENAERRLVAYFRAHEGSLPTAEQLRDHLRTLLPDYMIPVAFVVLETFPLTANGKLDRRALPAPDLHSHVTRFYQPPQGEIEESLARIWQELLHVERIGRDDDFFALGGHSLLAMRVKARFGALLSIELPMSMLFEYPMLSQLARAAESVREEALLKELNAGGDELAELLEKVTSMPEIEAQELIRILKMEGIHD